MRKVCVYTSTRAEYGLLRNLISALHESVAASLQLLVSGSHLVPEMGYTVDEIEADGFEPDECVDINLTDDSSKGICKSMGEAVSKYGQYFSGHSPDILVLLGDRFETFCCAAAAQVCGIPIAHIHGGESTQGAVDEAFRHSITKMAHLHFPCAGIYRDRIIQMGENPEYVWDVGALGVENIRKMALMSREGLEESLGFQLNKPFFLITFHPVTLEKGGAKKQFSSLLDALEELKDHKFIFTGSNADSGGRIIDQMQDIFLKKHPEQCLVVKSLGYLRYLSAMKLCDAVVGNSSSGILEAPVLKVPTVNIGDRQKGRIRTESIIDCDPSKSAILSAFKKIFEKTFQSKIKNMVLPFEKKRTAETIKQTIQNTDLTGILKKEFYLTRLNGGSDTE